MYKQPRHARRRLAGALLGVVLLGCAADRPATGELRGRALPEPVARPSFTLPTLDGAPYDFAARTTGKLTFLFFGYTYCPDICPIHLGALGAALAELPYEARQQVEVVFVTVDPERDTPARLREWLRGFDPTFVGLRGTLEQANAAAALAGLPPSSHGPVEKDGSYSVGHPAGMLAFSPDGPAYVLYPFGTRREDWVHDLPLLLGRRGDALAAETRAPGDVAPAESGLTVARAYVTRSRMANAAALYAVIDNGTSAAEALVGIDAPATRTELHETVREGEGVAMRMQMQPVAEIAVPARGSARLQPGGYHAMLLQPALEWVPGDTVTVRFRFRGGAVRTVQAPVVAHDEVAQRLEGGR